MRGSSQALLMWEIRNAIALSADYADARSLLYTSRAFFHAAIYRVWGTVTIDVQDLFKLLDGFEFADKSRLVTVELKIPRPLPSEYFDRFHIYAPHVRELEYCLSQPIIYNNPQELQYHSEDIRLLMSTIESKILLPGLASLRLGRLFPTLRPIYDLRLLGLFVPPSLTRLTLIENASLYQFHSKSFLQFLGTRIVLACPDLQALSLLEGDINHPSQHRDRAETETAYLFNGLPVPNRLSSLALSSDILNIELLIWISKIPNLKSLAMRNLQQIDALTISGAALPEDSFQNLRVLNLEGCEINSVAALWRTPIVAQIEEANLLIFSSYDARLEVLFNLVANRSRRIKTLVVGVDYNRQSEGDLSFTLNKIYAMPHENLVTFSLDGIELEGSNPVSVIARSCPMLRHLELTNHFIELKDFLLLPILLPQLEYLRVTGPEALGDPADLERLLPELESMPRSHTVSSLTFETFPFVTKFDTDVCDRVSRFLARWWPRMQLLSTEYPGNEKERAWVQACAYINQRILEFSRA